MHERACSVLSKIPVLQLLVIKIMMDDVMIYHLGYDYPRMRRTLRQNTDPELNELQFSGSHRYVQNMTEEDWEQLGGEVANNDHLEEFNVHDGALNNQKMTSLFRGLTRSSSIDAINLYENDPGQSMIPFVQNARNLDICISMPI